MLLKVKAASINPVDWKIREGHSANLRLSFITKAKRLCLFQAAAQ